jgi:creatinine amidohydrolase
MTVVRLEELSAPAVDALDRARTLVVLPVSPLEQHGPHLPVGVDFMVARHFAEAIGDRLVARRPDWTVALVPALPLGSFAFHAVGTVGVRQRALRDVVVDCGRALARAGFRYVLISNGHAGLGHLVALEEAAAIVSRRHRIAMASLTGHMAWEFLRGRYLPRIEAALGRTLTADERRAFRADAHAGWWETSLMLLLRPDLVDGGYRDLPPARYPLPRRLRPNFPLRGGGRGYVGEPGRADRAFAEAAAGVLLAEATDLVERLLDGRLEPRHRRSPFSRLPFLRTDFWPLAGAGLAALALGAWAVRSRRPGVGGAPRAAVPDPGKGAPRP